MAATPLESRILLITSGWFWWCGPVLNPLEYIISIRMRLLDMGDHILSQKRLVNVGIDMFTSGNPFLLTKICKTCPHCAYIPSFRTFAVVSGPHCCLAAFSDWKPCFCYCWVGFQIFVCCYPTQRSEWCFVNLHGGWETAHPRTPVYVITWTTAHHFS